MHLAHAWCHVHVLTEYVVCSQAAAVGAAAAEVTTAVAKPQSQPQSVSAAEIASESAAAPWHPAAAETLPGPL